MGMDDKIEANVDQAKGKVKEGVGGATGDRGLEAEGKKDQVKGNLKEGWENVKDAARDATH